MRLFFLLVVSLIMFGLGGCDSAGDAFDLVDAGGTYTGDWVYTSGVAGDEPEMEPITVALAFDERARTAELVIAVMTDPPIEFAGTYTAEGILFTTGNDSYELAFLMDASGHISGRGAISREGADFEYTGQVTRSTFDLILSVTEVDGRAWTAEYRAAR